MIIHWSGSGIALGLFSFKHYSTLLNIIELESSFYRVLSSALDSVVFVNAFFAIVKEAQLPVFLPALRLA
jgi:hypothetical protein